MIWLALYPDVADADNIKKIPRFNLRNPWLALDVGDMMQPVSFLLIFRGSLRCQALFDLDNEADILLG